MTNAHTLQLLEVWRTTSDGRRLLELATLAGVSRRLLVAAACECVRPTLRFIAPEDQRAYTAITGAEAWVRGQVATNQVRPLARPVCRAAWMRADTKPATAEDGADQAAYEASQAAAAAVYAVYGKKESAAGALCSAAAAEIYASGTEGDWQNVYAGIQRGYADTVRIHISETTLSKAQAAFISRNG